MDTDSDSSDFILPATTRNNRNTSLPSSNLTKSPDTENADNKENLPLLLVQGVEENEQDDCYEEAPMSNLHTTTPSNNSRPSRRTTVKTKATPQGQKPSTTADEKQSNSRRKRDSKVLVESDSESQDDDDDSFSSSDAESSTFEDSESSDSSLNEDTLKKQKARQESTKKTPKGRETKVKVEPKQKKATKAKTTKGVKSDNNNSKSNIPVRSIRSGLSSSSQAKLESSRLLHVRPIRAGLSKKSPIPRLHSSFSNHSSS
ncbi:hypothetical protein GAYE_HPEPCTG121G0113 [Galdieria yellowstonensis]|uniref:RAD51 interacting motif domain-containing protein n=1 Tax=Galdieria yellowstonensis TaxID=3028027 RepID=A0AAV9I2U0_9RHOD|nr:hypothetical protein GAYE_HPEPCTG121G0113 [Galdieria yellowstonensis]